jgi:hypothetical protein
MCLACPQSRQVFGSSNVRVNTRAARSARLTTPVVCQGKQQGPSPSTRPAASSTHPPGSSCPAAAAAEPLTFKGDMLNASYYPTRMDAANLQKKWYIIDAKGQTLGRLATLAATYIRCVGDTRVPPRPARGTTFACRGLQQQSLDGRHPAASAAHTPPHPQEGAEKKQQQHNRHTKLEQAGGSCFTVAAPWQQVPGWWRRNSSSQRSPTSCQAPQPTSHHHPKQSLLPTWTTPSSCSMPNAERWRGGKQQVPVGQAGAAPPTPPPAAAAVAAPPAAHKGTAAGCHSSWVLQHVSSHRLQEAA